MCPFKHCVLRNKTCLYVALPGSLAMEYNTNLRTHQTKYGHGLQCGNIFCKKFCALLSYFSPASHVVCYECEFVMILTCLLCYAFGMLWLNCVEFPSESWLTK